MIKLLLSATASALILAACATSAPDVVSPVETPASVEPIVPVAPSRIELAMGTVDTLVADGNTQTAIDRLTQLLGDETLAPDDTASVLLKRADLRASGQGYDLMGAISDYTQVLDNYSTSSAAGSARQKLDVANGEATSLNFLLAQPETSRSQRFESHFRLGQHNEALDLMLSSGLIPDNDDLIAMYQIGYLCSGETQTGPVYNALEPDGTPRELRFCDFGK